MRVLFVAPEKSCDFLASCLYDGLQEVCGHDNVIDAVGCDWLHAGSDGMGSDVVKAVSCVRPGRNLTEQGFALSDLIVLNACFNRECSWEWASKWLNHLKPGGKVAYVEGWDAAWQVNDPEIHVDAYFRKEIASHVQYPMQPHPLTFAAPARWFDWQETGDRPIDVYFSGNPNTCLPSAPVRWPALGQVFRTHRTHRSIIVTSASDVEYEGYLSMMRHSKLALCLPAADNADSFRTYEAVACGAIPIFVGYPNHVRDPWFPPELVYSCSVEDLPEHIDEALAHDLTEKRQALIEWSRKNHTTRARAEKLLKVVFG